MAGEMVKASDVEKVRERFDKRIRRYIKTDGVALLEKRKIAAAYSLQVQDMVAQILNPEVSNEKKAELSNLANILSMAGILCSLEVIADSVSWEEKVQIRGKGEGTRRMSLAEVSQHIGTALLAEDGLLDQLNDLVEMTNDLGIKQKAWLDKNGVHDDEKYLEPEAERAPTAGTTVVEEGEAMSDEDMEKLNQKLHPNKGS